FEVDTIGVFKVQYVDAVYPELIAESKRIFSTLPNIKPATYSGKPTYSRYTINIKIPLEDGVQNKIIADEKAKNQSDFIKDRNKGLKEFKNIVYKKFEDPVYKSQLNIPFSHNNYSRFDAALNQIGSNNHTASKPYNYAEVAKYYDLKAENKKLIRNSDSWWTRKLFNENLVQIQGDGYWLTLNPILDIRLGKSDGNKSVSTFQNTRGVQVNGGLGEQLVFTTSVFESQGRFADYYNKYAESIHPQNTVPATIPAGDPAIIPGIGIAKRFKTDAFDFPSAEANLTYTPSKFINLQLGYGRNFLGDGYRSLLFGDGASPYPYFKINTTFWKIKYTNTYLWLKDVRQDAIVDKTYATKFMANHYLSLNLSKKFTLGLFESVVWSNGNNRGFDMNFVNPIIFYRTVEFTSSSKTGNAVLGLTGKYKFNNQINFYSQFILDEFSLSDIKAQKKSWKNKYGYQVGGKYYNAFNIKNLLLQVEYNRVRPYVYSHSNPLTNYAHNNQSMGHQWGGNFEELIAITRYNNGRYFADAKFTYGVRGLDFDTATNQLNYGGNIYKNYQDDRAFNTNVKVGQGNKTTIFIADIQA
ncbi:MAG: gliding motility protein RemB, partial [Flavobacterium sp.]|nr:gliding motility protein RemB [Flavobacterium sp.]